MSDKPVHAASEHEGAILPAVDAIAQLDPSAIDELREYLAAFKKAKAAGKQPEVEYILRAIAEVFSAPEPSRGLSQQEVVELVAARPGAREAAEEGDRRHRGFLGAYYRLKERTGLATQRQVSEACKVSVATINAIEQGLVRPQFATVQRLAAGFNRLLPKGEHVAASDLMGC